MLVNFRLRCTLAIAFSSYRLNRIFVIDLTVRRTFSFEVSRVCLSCRGFLKVKKKFD